MEQDFSPAITDLPPALEQAAAADESVEEQAPLLNHASSVEAQVLPVVEQDFSPAIAAPPPALEQAAAADESVEAQAPPI